MRCLVFCIFLNSLSVFAGSEDIKTTDLKNEEMSSALNSEPGATLTPEQAEALKQQIEMLKENQKKSNELLNELETEK